LQQPKAGASKKGMADICLRSETGHPPSEGYLRSIENSRTRLQKPEEEKEGGTVEGNGLGDMRAAYREKRQALRESAKVIVKLLETG